MKGNIDSKGAAFLWDESFLWGLVAFRALNANGLKFKLLRCDDIKQGALAGYNLLFVPGGWASNKLKALGPEGAQAVREFVKGGGSYFGICGGAGLATGEGLGLLPIGRRPLKERVPSLSGRVRARLASHQIWGGKEKQHAKFHIWWPSQFVVNGKNIRILAEFEGATEDTFSSDIKPVDVKDWAPFEQSYGLNLDPARMHGDPLVVEGRYGRGNVLASLIHFDTPDDASGQAVLGNIWRYMGGTASGATAETETPRAGRQCAALLGPIEELMAFGLENSLWSPRGWTIQWRRGVRGLEYATLYEMAKELAAMTKDVSDARLDELSQRLGMFCRKAKTLLTMEKAALSSGEALSFSRASSPEMKELREELFSSSKSHGGEFKRVLDLADSLLYEKLE
ncbi:MAG: hypothetical protein M0018_07565 [Nitrospiraceae bacterium]|nr:hypothetical protein [Nitrospiraceae bacterium]